jgi:hypothetical protein
VILDKPFAKARKKQPPAAEWVTVYSGSRSAVLVLQVSLHARGIPTFVPDEQLKVIDPFITGANPFDVALQVPPRLAAEAQQLIRSGRQRAADLADGAAIREPLEGTLEHEQEQVRRLGERLCWCLAFPIFGWAVGAFLGFGYLRRARALPERPPRYRVIVLAWLLQPVLLAAALVARV